MSRNGNTTVGNNTNSKQLNFNLHKSVQVTKIFIRGDQKITKNEPIFSMVDTDNPGK